MSLHDISRVNRVFDLVSRRDYDRCHFVSSDDSGVLSGDIVEGRLWVDESSPKRDGSIAREIRQKPDLVDNRRSFALGWSQPIETEGERMSEFVEYWRNSSYGVDLDRQERERENVGADDKTKGRSRARNVICESREELSVALSTENDPLHIRLCQYLFWPWIREDEQQQQKTIERSSSAYFRNVDRDRRRCEEKEVS